MSCVNEGSDVSKETLNEKPKNSNKQINHCADKINIFLPKENDKVPDDVFMMLDEEMKKHGLNNYCEHIMFTHSKITNKSLQSISCQEYELVLDLFNKIMGMYQEIKPKNKYNFLSYRFVLNKLFLLIGRKDIASHFRLFKNSEKIEEHENIWNNICTVLDWDEEKIQKRILMNQKNKSNNPNIDKHATYYSYNNIIRFNTYIT